MQINVNSITDLKDVLTTIDNACNEIYSMIIETESLINSYNQSSNKIYQEAKDKILLLKNRYNNLLSIRQGLAKDIENKENILRKIMAQR